MDPPSAPSNAARASLFQTYLRLRPSQSLVPSGEPFLAVEPQTEESDHPTHITLNPPNDRRRAIEKFGFTQVFQEDASQLDVFHCIGVVPLVEGVLSPHGGDGTDALLATLGVTGSGKTHTMLGSRAQRGLTQLALDVLFRSIGHNMVQSPLLTESEASIIRSDASDAQICAANAFLDTVYGDTTGPSRHSSRAPTPMTVKTPTTFLSPRQLAGDGQREASLSALDLPGAFPSSPRPQQSPTGVRLVCRKDSAAPSPSQCTPTRAPRSGILARSPLPGHLAQSPLYPGMFRPVRKPQTAPRHFMLATATASSRNMNAKMSPIKGDYPSLAPPATPRKTLVRPSALPLHPDVSGINVSSDPRSEYAVLLSMYEVYNDRIFDLLTPPVKSAATKEYRRRPLLFKNTDLSTDRKVVAGLRKVICTNLNEALLVLEAGLHERRVAGTGSNSVSSRSHGFICIEVCKRSKKRSQEQRSWSGNTLTVVDLAGSERARDAKTAGATLAEAGKINESLMYLGQCLQMLSDSGNSNKPSLVPYRQCKLTELLLSNSFPSASLNQSTNVRRNPQKGVMIVTVDPHGDFNATSQILRYSALAREITHPRIPSLTQTLLASHSGRPAATATAMHGPCSSPPSSPPLHHRPFFPPGATAGSYHLPSSPNIERVFSPFSNASTSDDRITMEHAAMEIARLSDETGYLRESLEKETEKRHMAESHLESLADRLVDLEQQVREACMAEFDQRFALEIERWKANYEMERELNEEHWDRKMEVLERLQITVTNPSNESGMTEHDDAENKENVLIENLEEENERLRRELAVAKRQLAGRSPVKRKPLQEREDMPIGEPASPHAAKGGEALNRKMERLRVSDDAGRPSSASTRSTGSSSPKKMRKLATKKWDVAMDGDDLF